MEQNLLEDYKFDLDLFLTLINLYYPLYHSEETIQFDSLWAREGPYYLEKLYQIFQQRTYLSSSCDLDDLVICNFASWTMFTSIHLHKLL